MPPRTIKDRGATAPDTPGKLAKGEFVISAINQNFPERIAMNHKTLPPGYRYAGTLDFMRNRKQMKAMLVLSAALILRTRAALSRGDLTLRGKF